MKNSSLEITEQEYLIKLNKNDFDLSSIYRLLKRIQSEYYLSGSKNIYEADQTNDIRSNDDHLTNRFDSLRDK